MIKIKNDVLPKFVKLNSTTLRLKGKRYYRDGGDWSVGYKIIDGLLYSWCPRLGMPHLHKVLFVKITKKEYMNTNRGYLPKNF